VSASAYDAVIVGARCAGAALATYLARSGASVLLLDRDGLPSDQVLSTHTIHPPGMDVLDEIGVGEAVRDVAPVTRVMRIEKNGAPLDLRFPEGRTECCPRRMRLDGLLQDAARAAGAELLDRTRAVSLVEEQDRVVGVRALCDGRERVFRGGLVVGADGRRSTVAREVGAREYLGYDAPRAMYWAYFDAPDFWWSDPAYAFGVYVGHRGRQIRVVFQTDHGQLLIGSLPPLDETRPWRADPRGTLMADLGSDPVTAPLIEGAAPDGKVRGTRKERYFFRAAAGPGWALVGDAGHHKEFVLGDGITEALIQARSLAAAIGEGTDAATLRWWRARDVEALPLFCFGRDEGSPEPPPELQRLLFARLERRPEVGQRMLRAIEHEASPYEAIPASAALACLAAAVLRGRLGVLREAVALARRAGEVDREWRARKRMLRDFDAA
jgi:flavin-dependent dehydrogenase